MSPFLQRVARNARTKAERQYDRRMPARAAHIDAFILAAVNAAKVEEREQAAKAQQTREQADIRRVSANAQMGPIRQQCVVVRKGPALPARREFVPPARRIVRTFTIPDSVEGVPEDLRIAA